MGDGIEVLPVADQYALLAATGLLTIGRGRLSFVHLTAGSDDATLLLYDGNTVNGRLLLAVSVTTGLTVPLDLGYRLHFDTGLYAVITGTLPRCFASWMVEPINTIG